MTKRRSEIEAERPSIPHSTVEKIIPTYVKAWLILEMTCVMAMYIIVEYENK